MGKTSARGLFRAMGKTAKPVGVIAGTDLGGQYERAEHLARESDDFYPTPPEPIRALLHAEGWRLRQFTRGIWECAAGDGALVREMRAFGLAVHASDLIDRGCGATIRDFYAYGSRDAPADAIVTNPPWGEGQEWALHGRDKVCAPYMALLMPWKWPASGKMAGLWDVDPPARAYLMRWRIDWTGMGANPSNDAWYVWDGNTPLGETRMLMLDRKDARQWELAL